MSRPKLLDQLRMALRPRHRSPRTEQAYVRRVRWFVRFHGLGHPARMGVEEIGAFLTHVAVDRRVSASAQNQAASALRSCTTRCRGAAPDILAA